MSRVVWLLLGAALLCGHEAFCRRVVSGESGGHPPAERTSGRETVGAREGGALRSSLSWGGDSPGDWEPVPGGGGEMDCALLSSPPPKTHVKKFKFFGSA